jgi:hypothetical protein
MAARRDAGGTPPPIRAGAACAPASPPRMMRPMPHVADARRTYA